MELDDLFHLQAGAVMVDPPWLSTTYSDKGRGKSVDRHYRPQSTDWIKALPVAAICAPDCAVVLWCPQTHVLIAGDVLAAWGFTFVTQGAWAKQSKTGQSWQFGTGHVLRSAAEFYLVGRLGRPKRRSCSVRNLIVAPVREHSRKPDQIYEDIEALWPGPYVELFARYPRPGWIQRGDQFTGGDAL